MRNAAVFILTHGRAGRVITYKTLRNSGYTGPIFLVLDTGDEQISQYEAEFGAENCIVFSKADWKGKFDFLKDICEVVYLPRTPEISSSKMKRDLYDANSIEGESKTSHSEIETDPK